MSQCDICTKTIHDFYWIKWPGLDTGSQYEAVCKECNSLFIEIRKQSESKKRIELIEKLNAKRS